MPGAPAPVVLLIFPALIALPFLSTRSFSGLGLTSSLLLRLVAFLFLRVIPAPFGPTLSPPFFFLYFIGWFVVDRRLDAVEREMGKGGDGVLRRQAEKLGEWQKVEADGSSKTDVDLPEAQIGPEVVEAAKARAAGSEGSAKANGSTTQDKKPAAPGSPTAGRSYASVAAAPPPSTTTSASAKQPSDDSDLKRLSSSSRSPPLTYSASRLLPFTLYPYILAIPFGAPSRSRVLNRFSLLINFLLLFSCLDATFRPLLPLASSQVGDLAFSRIGATGDDWVNIAVRVPPLVVPARSRPSPKPATLLNAIIGESAAGVGAAGGSYDEAVHVASELSPEPEALDIIVGARVIYRPTRPVGKWSNGPKIVVSEDTDWTGVAKLDGLFPGTEYEYRLALPDSPATHHPAFPEVGYFKTFPDHRLSTASVFTFGTTSCIKAGFPYNPLKGVFNNRGADILASFVQKNPLDLFLFLGDFVYVDTPWFSGPFVKAYHRLYRQTYATPGWQKLMRLTPTLHIYDDHEIYNDWSGHAEEDEANPVFRAANKAYRDYQGVANYDGPGGDKNYYWFRHGDAAFFVWDTRRYRSSNSAPDDEEKTMLGAEQKQVFFDWLSAVNSTVTFKFVISSVPFMTMWHSQWVDAIDTWAGFVTERSELLSVMEYVPNLIVLSGDRHEFAAATIRETVFELSTSPLNQFWLPTRTLRAGNSLGGTEDHLLKYIPEGKHKFTTISVDTRVANAPKLEIKVFRDGDLAWNVTYLAKPVREPARQIGSILPSLLELLGLKPRRWFRPYTVNESI